MRTIPRHVLRHVGQRAAQLAVWGIRAPGRSLHIASDRRVTKAEWQFITRHNLIAQHIVEPNGQVILTRITYGW